MNSKIITIAFLAILAIMTHSTAFAGNFLSNQILTYSQSFLCAQVTSETEEKKKKKPEETEEEEPDCD